MQFRKFQKEDISEIGLGTWQLGSSDWGALNEETAMAILQAYVDEGGNFIDTADVYGMGISEQMIGRFLQTNQHTVYVATKLGRRQDEANGWPQNFTYDFMKRHTEASLLRLSLSQLFLQQLHCIPKEEMKSGKVFDHLRRLRDEGIIRYFGASVETTEEALICLEQDGLASLQIIFNLFRQHIAEEIFAKAKERNIALIVRVPLASGLLTGKFNSETQFDKNDHRNYNAGGKVFNSGETFSGIDFKKGLVLAEDIKKMLPDERIAQWSLRWILDHPEVTTVIPGASKIQQVKNNMEVSGMPALPSATHAWLKTKYTEEIKGIIQGHY